MMGFVSLLKEGERERSEQTCPSVEERRCEDSEKAAICKPGK